jgi:hypothetical protein
MPTVKAKVAMPITTDATESFSRLFQKHIDDTTGKHSGVELQTTAFLTAAHILRKALT